jgi:hypothetical protein
MKQTLVLPTDAVERNQYPIWDGVLAYFPAAIAEMSRLSKVGNDQHNPGEPMHWAREKSRDHKNKILKHMLDTGPVDAPVYDSDGVLHSVKMAWRACAFAQEQLEALGRPHGENAAPEASK